MTILTIINIFLTIILAYIIYATAQKVDKISIKITQLNNSCETLYENQKDLMKDIITTSRNVNSIKHEKE